MKKMNLVSARVSPVSVFYKLVPNETFEYDIMHERNQPSYLWFCVSIAEEPTNLAPTETPQSEGMLISIYKHVIESTYTN